MFRQIGPNIHIAVLINATKTDNPNMVAYLLTRVRENGYSYCHETYRIDRQ